MLSFASFTNLLDGLIGKVVSSKLLVVCRVAQWLEMYPHRPREISDCCHQTWQTLPHSQVSVHEPK